MVMPMSDNDFHLPTEDEIGRAPDIPLGPPCDDGQFPVPSKVYKQRIEMGGYLNLNTEAHYTFALSLRASRCKPLPVRVSGIGKMELKSLYDGSVWLVNTGIALPFHTVAMSPVIRNSPWDHQADLRLQVQRQSIRYDHLDIPWIEPPTADQAHLFNKVWRTPMSALSTPTLHLQSMVTPFLQPRRRADTPVMPDITLLTNREGTVTYCCDNATNKLT